MYTQQLWFNILICFFIIFGGNLYYLNNKLKEINQSKIIKDYNFKKKQIFFMVVVVMILSFNIPIYGLIINNQLQAINPLLDMKAINMFNFSQYFSLILAGIITFVFVKKITENIELLDQDQTFTNKYFTYVTLMLGVSQIPVIIGLIQMFNFIAISTSM